MLRLRFELLGRQQQYSALCDFICFPMQERAVAYLNDIKAQPQCWQICLEKYATTSYLEVRFWCLQVLHEVSIQSMQVLAYIRGSDACLT